MALRRGGLPTVLLLVRGEGEWLSGVPDEERWCEAVIVSRECDRDLRSINSRGMALILNTNKK